MNEKRRMISPALLALARRAGDGDVPPSAGRRARDDLAAALSHRASSPIRRYAPLLAAAALCVSIAVFAMGSFRLRFSVSGAVMVTPAGYVRADEDSAAITFSDGTQVALSPRSTVRVESAGLRGADLVQERGSATYTVVHRPAASWSVDAGPYRVRVTGTKFAVTWLPEPGEMVTELYEGSVIIDGPQAEGGVQLHAGERLRAVVGRAVVVEQMGTASKATDARVQTGSEALAIPLHSGVNGAKTSSIPLRDGEIAEDTSSAPLHGGVNGADTSSAPLHGGVNGTDTSSAPLHGGVNGTDTSSPPLQPGVNGADTSSAPLHGGVNGADTSSPPLQGAPTPTAPLSLSARIAQGDAPAIAAEVEQEGIASFAARASASDLALVADAARYAKRPALANAALLALRQHYAGTREAALAAFHLGRAADESSPAQAILWYDAYLAETGGAGAFAPEARGRKMAAVKRVSGDAAAKPLAEAYLVQHPKGPYAQLARAIIAAVP